MAHAEARLGSPASITTRLRPGPGIVTRAGVSLTQRRALTRLVVELRHLAPQSHFVQQFAGDDDDGADQRIIHRLDSVADLCLLPRKLR